MHASYCALNMEPLATHCDCGVQPEDTRTGKGMEHFAKGLDTAEAGSATFGWFHPGAPGNAFTRCQKPHPGWQCTRKNGHSGPCANVPVDQKGTLL